MKFIKIARVTLILFFLFAIGYSIHKAKIAKDSYKKVCSEIGAVRQESFRTKMIEDEAVNELLKTASADARKQYMDSSAAAIIAKGELRDYERRQIRIAVNGVVYLGGGFVWCILIYLFRFRKKN